MIKAAVFDMDGVIFDSEKIYRLCEHEQAKKYGLPDERVERFCELIAGGTKESNRKHFKEVFPETTADYYEFREGVMKAVDDYANTKGYELKPGVKELFDFLKENGIKIALATSTAKPRAEYHLKAHGIFDYFDVFVYGDEIKRGKPAPDIYLKACEKLQVEPCEALGIEDSINGILSSATAGLYTVMVIDLIKPNDYVRANAHGIFDSLIELKPVFESLSANEITNEAAKSNEENVSPHKLYFTRHGETFWNVANKICGATDIGLTKKGHEQAVKLGNMIKESDYKIDKILYSPLMRAKDTALHISEITGIPAYEEIRLKEQNFGKYEGTARHGKEFELAKKSFIDDFGTGENMLKLNHRIYDLLDELKKDTENTYLLVAHNGIARSVYSYFNNMTNEDYARFGIDNCSVLEFDYK